MVPAFGHPERCGAVAAIRDEGEEFAVAHEAVGEFIGREQNLVARPFVIKLKRVAGAADRGDAAMVGDETGGPGSLRGLVPAWDGRGQQRVLREGVQDVGDQQFLVLLLVVQAELDERGGGRRRGRQVIRHRRVDMARGSAVTGGPRGRVSRPRCGRGWRAPTAS